MTFTVDFGRQFAVEWNNYQQDQKDKVASFVITVQVHGLDQTKLPGKLSASWINANATDHAYALRNDLWHYHIGLPTYRVNMYGPATSDWLLHFQHVSGSTHISIVDMYTHYTSKGGFYLPKPPHVVPVPVKGN